MKFSTIKAAVFDMDGVLWRGNKPLPGLVELFRWLEETGTPYVLATNNSSKTQADYVQKLAHMGIPDVAEEHIVTSGIATALYIAEHYPPETKVYVFGMEGLKWVMRDAGLTVVEDEHPDVVVVGINFDLSYKGLKEATLHIRNGAHFIATNTDKTFPTPDGLAPGAGSLVAALEAASDVEALVIGKPNDAMFHAALEVLETAPEQTLMVGDRLETDIQGAKNAGMPSALLFTGVTQPERLADPQNDIWPDVAYDGLPELLKAWAGDAWYREQVKLNRGRA